MGDGTTSGAFGDVLRHLREAAGLTQEALAERAGLSARAISALERGVNRAPRRDTLERLTSALDLPTRKRAQLLAAVRPGVADPSSNARLSVLPQPATALLGRGHEVDAVTALIRRPEVRLVTLTGAGGIGKTRMAIQVADDLGELFDDGLAYVELAHVPDHGSVSHAIGSVLSLREAAEHAMADRLAAYLQNKHLLLVLDNFEHVVAAAALVARLLDAAPRLKVLVTSRAALRLRGEHAFVVTPLALPGVSHAGTGHVADLLRYPAVALFVERSQAAGSRLRLDLQTLLTVVEICRRLDGLPLAIELAAARSNILPPRALLAHLDIRLPVLTGGARDAPTRQRTMRDAIGWSYALLDPEQQTAFRWLAVCVGGCTLAAAEAVLGDRYRQKSDVSPLDVVAALVDQSLLNAHEDMDGEPRLRMLEVVREYGLEHLAGDGEAGAARERHARHFLELAARSNEFRRIQCSVSSLAPVAGPASSGFREFHAR